MKRRTLLGLVLAPGIVPFVYLVIGLVMRLVGTNGYAGEWLLHVVLQGSLLYGVTLVVGVPLFRFVQRRREIGFRETVLIALAVASAALIVVSLVLETNVYSFATNAVYYLAVGMVSAIAFWSVAVRGQRGIGAPA
jgi:cation transport ATPase